MENKDTERYLCDGVYASFDGYQIWLQLDHVVRIALEPAVYRNLVIYAKHLNETTVKEPGDKF